MQVKHCPKCGETKPLDEFGLDRSTRDGLTSRCRECRRQFAADPEAARTAGRQRTRRWRQANREAIRETKRRRYAADREAVLDHYGRKCACCGSTEKLTVDHVRGGGTVHRKEVGGGGPGVYRWLIKNNFPADPPTQLLCDPCNKSKGAGASCRIDHATKTVVPALPWIMSEDKSEWRTELPDGRTAVIRRVLGEDGESSLLFVPAVYESALDFVTGPECAGVLAAAAWAAEFAAAAK